jgi:hypothetical protein
MYLKPTNYDAEGMMLFILLGNTIYVSSYQPSALPAGLCRYLATH